MALKPLNSVGGFSVGEIPQTIITGNGNITANFATFSGNVVISNVNANYGLLTDNLYYSNGQPWDLQEAAGSNNQIQFNSNNDFAASANLTFDPTSNTFTVLGNANLTTVNTSNIESTGNLFLTANGFTVSLYANGLVEFENGAFTTGNITVGNASLGNLVTANFIEVSSNLITNNLTVNADISANTANFSGNVSFDGAEVSISNDLQGNTATFSGNVEANNLSVINDLDSNNVTITSDLDANTANFSGNVTFSGSEVTVDNELIGNTANFSGNVYAAYFVGNVEANITITAGNTQVLFSNSGLVDGSNNFTFDFANNVLFANGTANITGNTSVGGILTDNYYYANGAPVDFQQPAGSNTQLQFNDNDDFGASANLTFDFANNTLNVNGNANITTVNTSNVVGTGADVTINANGYVSTFYGANGNVSLPQYLNVTNNVSANWFIGNLSGNTVEANVANIAQTLNGNVANFSGNLTALNANLGNLATANYINVANDLNVIGNVNAGNLVGPLANGTSNVRIFQDANIEFSSNGVSNVVTITDSALLVAGNIQATTGNISANGNVTANGYLLSANANVTGTATIGILKTDTIDAVTSTITMSAGANGSIELVPNGTGTVDVSNFRITQVADPVDPRDAANKEYVDALAGEGLTIHTPVRVAASTNLVATYTGGGVTHTATDIALNSQISFSVAHGLSINDMIIFDNTFNGITGGEAYFVASVVDATTITIKDTYGGITVTTLTNGTGLTQNAVSNPGVGATLTNAGANAAIVIDSIALSTNDRVLVFGQTNGFENGVYIVSDIGGVSSAWVLTRSSDMDTYAPASPNAMTKGDYVFVEQGATQAGASYVLTSPSGEIIIGTDDVVFTEFSKAGSYTAGNGISIVGTLISANVDGITTDIVGGNIVVKASANLTTPNLGDATFSSLTWNTLSNGNVTANNLSIGNIANIGLDLTVGGNIQANGTISSNANVSGLNLTTSGNVQASGNVLANNITANTLLTVPTANVSNIVNAGNVTVTNELSGNTANFSGNVVLSNLTVNLELAGNTANFTSVTIADSLTGNTANFSGNVVVNNLGVNLELSGNTANFTGNVTAGNISANNFDVDNIVANTTIELGNTAFYWGTITTTSITANQAIAQAPFNGVTGIEYIVKGEDSTGAKYSMATVQAVTDGSNVDYSTFGTVNLGGTTGSLSVAISGSNLVLQVTPSSSNSTVWTTQYRLI